MGAANREGRYRGGGGEGGLLGSEEAQREWSATEERVTKTGGELFGGWAGKLDAGGGGGGG